MPDGLHKLLNYNTRRLLLVMMLLTLPILLNAQTRLADDTQTSGTIKNTGRNFCSKPTLTISCSRKSFASLWSRQRFVADILTTEPFQKYSPEMMRKRAEAERLIAKNKEKLKQNPDDIDAHKAIGISYLFLEEYEAAYNSFKEVLRVARNDADAHWGMGQAYGRAGDDAKALPFYREAVRLNPRLAIAQVDLGHTLVRLFQYNEAITHSRRLNYDG
jgi:tetratricopeptide (TPR) repeat protein